VQTQYFTRRHFCYIAAAGSVAITGVARAQAPQPMRLRATIDAVDGTSLSLTTRAGEKVTVSLAPNATVVAIVPVQLDDIKPGSYVGTAAMPQPDGTLRALEVHVMPESMRGAGEGHRPFDLQPQSTMTNGTVGTVTGSSNRMLTIAYAGGEKTVAVAANTPIVTYEPGSPALLVPGAHIILFGNQAPDGKVTATRISVGKDGLVPPM
jgi:hypothetical protein